MMGEVQTLTRRQELFCQAYAASGKKLQAALDAGYSKGAAASVATRLLKNPMVRSRVKALTQGLRTRWKAEADEILEHLSLCATRDGRDFVDDKGVLITNVNDLPERVTVAIDGIEQDETEQELPDGTILRRRKTKLKLVPKAAALDMAMKHHGLFAPEKVQTLTAHVTLEQLTQLGEEVPDMVEERIAREAPEE